MKDLKLIETNVVDCGRKSLTITKRSSNVINDVDDDELNKKIIGKEIIQSTQQNSELKSKVKYLEDKCLNLENQVSDE